MLQVLLTSNQADIFTIERVSDNRSWRLPVQNAPLKVAIWLQSEYRKRVSHPRMVCKSLLESRNRNFRGQSQGSKALDEFGCVCSGSVMRFLRVLVCSHACTATCGKEFFTRYKTITGYPQPDEIHFASMWPCVEPSTLGPVLARL